MADKSHYQAPAFTKGLDILELFASAAASLIMSDISTALGRSVSEIFRMLQVLEEHRYIARGNDGYRLTNRLFALSMAQPPVSDPSSAALPVVQHVARQTGQSCHLAVVSGVEMVVIAAREAPGLSGFAVCVGYRRPLQSSASGRILLAFQLPQKRYAMLEDVRLTGAEVDKAKLVAQLGEIVADGGGEHAKSGANRYHRSVSADPHGKHSKGGAYSAVGPAGHVTLTASKILSRAAAAAIAEQLAPEIRDGAGANPRQESVA